MVSPRLVALGERRRQEIVQLVVDGIAASGYSPTIRELAAELGVQPTAARQHVQILIAQGRLTQVPGKARTLRPVKRTRRRAS